MERCPPPPTKTAPMFNQAVFSHWTNEAAISKMAAELSPPSPRTPDVAQPDLTVPDDSISNAADVTLDVPKNVISLPKPVTPVMEEPQPGAIAKALSADALTDTSEYLPPKMMKTPISTARVRPQTPVIGPRQKSPTRERTKSNQRIPSTSDVVPRTDRLATEILPAHPALVDSSSPEPIAETPITLRTPRLPPAPLTFASSPSDTTRRSPDREFVSSLFYIYRDLANAPLRRCFPVMVCVLK